MSHLKSFLKKRKKFNNNAKNETKEEKNDFMKINLREEGDGNENENNKSDEESSSDYSIKDIDRTNLQELNRYIEKKKRKEEKKILYHKKPKLNYNPIKYDEKRDKILETFIPSIEELNNFFFECNVKTYTVDEFTKSLKSESYSSFKSFDIEEWMKKNNIDKKTISQEDICNYSENKKIEKEPEFEPMYKEYEENKYNFISERFKNPKLAENYDKLQTVIYSKKLSNEQIDFLVELFEEMNSIDLKDIDIGKNKDEKTNKLNIVLDLDNTCIFSYFYDTSKLLVKNISKKFPEKQVIIIDFKKENTIIHNVMIIRKGLKEFFKYIEPFCNFYISTLSFEQYGKAIKDYLSNTFGITFLGFQARTMKNNKNVEPKRIIDLGLNKENTIIFDDNISVWAEDYENVIISKFFFDEKLTSISPNKRNNNKSELDLFLESYKSIYYNAIIKFNGDWKKQKIKAKSKIFYKFKGSDSYNENKFFTAEYLDTKNLQFLYMKNVVKQIYILKFVYHVEISIAIKMIRMSTLANMKFDLKYLESKKEWEILKEIIECCGGIIFNKNNIKPKTDVIKENEKIYLIISYKVYDSGVREAEIKKDLKENPYYAVVNEKYILDSYYLMTNLKDQINTTEYTYDIK